MSATERLRGQRVEIFASSRELLAMNLGSESFIVPDWAAPANVRAVCTTRLGGCSQGVYAGLNLGQHVGDDVALVDANRRLVRDALHLPSEPRWLEQVHGVRSVEASGTEPGCQADAAWTDVPGVVCVVMTADCLPVFFCDDSGTRVAVSHAGWRGLADGVLEAAVASLKISPERLMAWLGPAIGPRAFEIGDEVRERFVDDDAQAAPAFVPGPVAGKHFADLYALARRRLHRAGLDRVGGGNLCTHTDATRFFSFRRDGRCGRMASLIWLDAAT